MESNERKDKKENGVEVLITMVDLKKYLSQLNDEQLSEAKIYFDLISNGETKKLKDIIYGATHKLYHIESLLRGANELLNKGAEDLNSSVDLAGHACVLTEIAESKVQSLSESLDT